MKTIKELADELGVSKTAVMKKIDNRQPKTANQIDNRQPKSWRFGRTDFFAFRATESEGSTTCQEG